MNAGLDSSLRSEVASATITTTLYDLIDAMQDEAEPFGEEEVVASVVNLLRSGRIMFLRAPETFDALASACACKSYS